MLVPTFIIRIETIGREFIQISIEASSCSLHFLAKYIKSYTIHRRQLDQKQPHQLDELMKKRKSVLNFVL